MTKKKVSVYITLLMCSLIFTGCALGTSDKEEINIKGANGDSVKIDSKTWEVEVKTGNWENSVKVNENWTVEIKTSGANWESVNINTNWLSWSTINVSNDWNIVDIDTNWNTIRQEIRIGGEGNKEEIEQEDCQEVYNEIIADKGEDYDDCGIEIKKSDCGPEDKNGNHDWTVKPKKTNIVMVFDSSWSMGWKIWRKTKMQIAKTAANRFASSISKQEDVNLWLVVYGHKGASTQVGKDESCKWIEKKVDLQKVDKEKFSKEINSLNPAGRTPIADSLEEAEKILSKYDSEEYENIIFLISDWEETCWGNPIEVAKRLDNVIVNVVWFDVSGVAEAQLKSIAAYSKWEYYTARTLQDMENAFGKWEDDFKNKMAHFDCGMEKFWVNLDSALNAQSKNFECKHRLNMEKVAVDVSVTTNFGSTCWKFVKEAYKKRFDNISSMLDKIYDEAKKELDENKKEEDKEFEKMGNPDINLDYDVDALDFDVDVGF